jgi:hypothetical protein
MGTRFEMWAWPFDQDKTPPPERVRRLKIAYSLPGLFRELLAGLESDLASFSPNFRKPTLTAGGDKNKLR